ncbi:MAG TPA: hypothetical protein VGG37_06495 [Opitutaceae bacterium]|jgi:hypothetical protein
MRASGLPFPLAAIAATGLEDFGYFVSIDDPQGRMVGCQFEAGDGSALTYSHNGFAHAGDFPGQRIAGFHFGVPLPADARLVCWLITPRSLVTIPLKLHDVAFAP